MRVSRPGIVFMGTPDFAVPSLEILVKNHYPVRAVVTAPDKPSGRGLNLRESAVKSYAVSAGIPVLQPVNLKDEFFVRQLAGFSADIFVVVAFRMLPERVWSIPTLGTINLHASLLPLYRGAAPINHAIINGESVTGVTTFIIDKEIDKGKILLQEKIEIGENEDAGSLHDRLMITGAGLVLKTIEAMASGTVSPKPQKDSEATVDLPAAPKLTKSVCRIDWSRPAEAIRNFVRGLSPYPAAWTKLMIDGRELNLKVLKLTDCRAGTIIPRVLLQI
jgi:methionyl-tRNA formyltransferase